ncbi:Ger(x)C family spore germination protein [Paenibacillus puldeungensis]|uniref:Ger(X)C family spore germination protein n=2 Tax=Paenibacillus puldeungensis TaxID=696536 RepID=A0ABW3RXH5_9BACL
MGILARTWGILLLSILLLLLLGGCWDRKELNELALVSALSLDKAENNQIQATVQLVLPQSQTGSMGGGNPEGGMSGRTSTQSETGVDVTDALSKLQGKIPRRMFWGQCKIFIFNEAVAREGIQEELDFLLRSPQTRERAYMFVSKGSAAKVLELMPSIERTSADVLRRVSDLKIGMRVNMKQFSGMLMGESQAAILPLVYIVPQSLSSEQVKEIPNILGSVLFKKDRMVGEISEKTTRGVMWIRNEIGEYTIVFDTEEGRVSLRPIKSQAKLIPEIKGEDWMMTIKVKSEGDIEENNTLLNPLNPKYLAVMNKGFEKDVKERIELAINEVQRKQKVDVLDFAKAFHRKYPRQWEKMKERWAEQFPKVRVNIEVHASINRPGLTSSPGGVPKEEVRER